MSSVRPTRPNDYLYDPVYTVSCYKDHMKALAEARTASVVIVPNFRNMFSDLRTYPASSIHFRTHAPSTDLGQDRYVPVDPHPNVTGTNRFKYFRKPLIPYVDPPSAPSASSSTTTNPARPSSTFQGIPTSSMLDLIDPTLSPTKKINVAIQTMYRENEVQTDPYSPEYRFTSGQTYPEILALATLTYQAGLPVGLPELEMIERARLKKAWEQSLPLAVDEASFQKRLKMMEAMELKEWADREKEIQRLQKRKLALLAHVLMERTQKSEAFTQLRIQKLWQTKMIEKKMLKEKMELKKAKWLRKLMAKRKQGWSWTSKKDIIASMAHPSREIPKLRDGIPTHLKSIKNPQLQFTLPLINDLEKQTSQKKELQFSLTMPNLKMESTPAARKEAMLLAQLEHMDLKLKKSKKEKTELSLLNPSFSSSSPQAPLSTFLTPNAAPSLRFLMPLPKPVERAPTPTLPIPDPQEKLKNETALLIQRYLRGRSVQLEMEKEKEKRHDLIEELRLSMAFEEATLDSISNDGASLTSSSKDSQDVGSGKEMKKEVKKEDLDEERDKEEVVDFIQAEFVGQYLDYVHKELTRLQDEKKLAAMVKLAERTRRMREAQESGRRQKELERREREDLVFKQVMQLQQETVDTFLEEILVEGMDTSSTLSAKAQVETMLSKMNDVLDRSTSLTSKPRSSVSTPSMNPIMNSSVSMPSSSTTSSTHSLALVSELMASFLIPETEKKLVRQQIEHEQEKYILAAHQVIYDVLPQVEEALELEKLPVPIPNEILQELTSDLNETEETAPPLLPS